jgi:phosphatidylinositol glycan class B
MLSMTSLFNAHLLPRALSTSPETLLTSLALLYFPLPKPEAPTSISVGDVKPTSIQTKEATPISRSEGQTLHLQSVQEMDYVMMDRMTPHLERSEL